MTLGNGTLRGIVENSLSEGRRHCYVLNRCRLDIGNFGFSGVDVERIAWQITQHYT